jgi:hypothetical protein
LWNKEINCRKAQGQKTRHPDAAATCTYRRTLAHIMKTLQAILFFLLTINVSGQITVEDKWSTPIVIEFNSIKEIGADTLLVYYEEYGPWTSLPDSCNSIPLLWIIWSKGDEYFAKRIVCNQTNSNPPVNVSSMPINYLLKNITQLKHRKIDCTTELSFRTDDKTEHLVFMTSKNRISLNITDFQREDKTWRNIDWVNASIKVIDTTKYELRINNVR